MYVLLLSKIIPYFAKFHSHVFSFWRLLHIFILWSTTFICGMFFFLIMIVYCRDHSMSLPDINFTLFCCELWTPHLQLAKPNIWQWDLAKKWLNKVCLQINVGFANLIKVYVLGKALIVRNVLLFFFNL